MTVPRGRQSGEGEKGGREDRNEDLMPSPLVAHGYGETRDGGGGSQGFATTCTEEEEERIRRREGWEGGK